MVVSKQKEINSMDFSEDGNFLATASDDEFLRIYNCNRGVFVLNNEKDFEF